MGRYGVSVSKKAGPSATADGTDSSLRAGSKLFLLTFYRDVLYPSVEFQQELNLLVKDDILRGTLDLLVLKTLGSMGPLHGYGIARRIEQVSGDLLHLNQGTIYPALLRLQQKRWITAKWGASENNRRARYYSLTPAGRKQLIAETESWERMVEIMSRSLDGLEEA